MPHTCLILGKSRAGEHYFLKTRHNNINNGPILTLSTIIKHVVGSVQHLRPNCLCFSTVANNHASLGHPGENGAHPAQNHHNNQPLINEWSHNQNCVTQSRKINGHGLWSAQMTSTKPIHISVETKWQEPCRLSYKTSSANSTSMMAQHLPLWPTPLSNMGNNQNMLVVSYCQNVTFFCFCFSYICEVFTTSFWPARVCWFPSRTKTHQMWVPHGMYIINPAHYCSKDNLGSSQQYIIILDHHSLFLDNRTNNYMSSGRKLDSQRVKTQKQQSFRSQGGYARSENGKK